MSDTSNHDQVLAMSDVEINLNNKEQSVDITEKNNDLIVDDQATSKHSRPDPVPPTEAHLRLAEALVFACAMPVSMRALAQVLPVEADPAAVMAALKERYSGRGVELAETGGGFMFRTALDIAPHLVKVIEVPRRLPRAAMEALAIIAYHQPVTRAEIEEIRGAALAQTSLELLLENGLVTSKGRKETPGRPTMWGTTPAFLAQFGLKELTELPKREELLVEPPSLLPDAGGQPAAVEDEADAGASMAPDSVTDDVAADGGMIGDGLSKDNLSPDNTDPSIATEDAPAETSENEDRRTSSA